MTPTITTNSTSDFSHIAQNLSSTTPDFQTLPSLHPYRAHLSNFTIHDIRFDPGVRYVEHDSYIQHIGSTSSSSESWDQPPTPMRDENDISARNPMLWTAERRIVEARSVVKYYYCNSLFRLSHRFETFTDERYEAAMISGPAKPPARIDFLKLCYGTFVKNPSPKQLRSPC